MNLNQVLSSLRTSGESCQQMPIATWDSANGVWVKDQVNLLCGHSVPFSEVFPASGQMVTMPDGSVCVLPMLARHTQDLEHSLSDYVERLPTPAARDKKDGNAVRVRDGVIQTDTIARAVLNSGEITLLGTPRTSTAHGSTSKQRANGALKGRLEDQVDGSYEGLIDWGKFLPAIRRWEKVSGRIAPAPTKPDGKEGSHRLSSAFTEWMMGLPEGWVTDAGLTRAEELKACGNGVVPQQAELALRLLLSVVDNRDE